MSCMDILKNMYEYKQMHILATMLALIHALTSKFVTLFHWWEVRNRDSATYDFSGHLTASSGGLFDQHLEHLRASVALATHSPLLYTIGDCIYLFCQLLVGRGLVSSPSEFPSSPKPELSAHSLIN